MSASRQEEVVRRWQANAAAAGVRLTDEDIERISSRGTIDRVLMVEHIIATMKAANTAPDYLHVLSVYTGGGSHERG
jgi:hypothetical protein